MVFRLFLDASPIRHHSVGFCRYFAGGGGGAASGAEELAWLDAAEMALVRADLAKLGRNTAEELMSIEPSGPTYRAKTDEASALAANSAAEMVTPNAVPTAPNSRVATKSSGNPMATLPPRRMVMT